MKYFLTIIAFLPAINFNISYAQDNSRILNSQETIVKAYELYSEEDPEGAISELRKIHESDSNYLISQIALLELFEESGKYDDQISLSKKLLKSPTEKNLEILLYLSRALSNKTLYDSSLALLEEAKVRYPYNPAIFHLIGHNYYMKNDIDVAIENLIKSIKANPYYQNPHLLLGKLMILQGNKVRAMLCLETYLALNPSDLNTLRLLENCFNHAVKDEKSIDRTIEDGVLHELELIVRSKAATDERFKSSFDLDISTTRQTELVFELLPSANNENDFWFDFYIPLFREIKNNQLEETFIYHILTSTESDQVTNWLNKNEKEQSRFFDIANAFISSKRQKMMTEIYPERKEQRQFWFYDNNKLNAIGDQIDDETYIGPWTFYFDNDEKQAEGVYDNKSEFDGEWKFYYKNGRISSISKYKNGVEIDTSYSYFDNGSRKEIAFYEDGELEGDVKLFYRYNVPMEILTYKDNLKHGNGVTYYVTGNRQSEYNFANDTLSGKHILYYKNGQINEIEHFKKGLSDGEFLSYHPNGKLHQKGQSIEGEKTGKWVSYYENGEIEFEGELKNNKKSGTWKYFNEDKILVETETYNDEGEKTGAWESFDEEGNKYAEFYYDNDLLTGYKYFDLHGNVLSEASDENGNFSVVYFHDNGQKSFEGTFKNGLLDGEAISYYHTGNIKNKGVYEEGNLNGEYTEYYETGEVDLIITYENGVYQGPYKEYFKNGNLEVDGYLVNGNSENLWIYYYPNGTKSREFYFVNNDAHGLSIDYAVDGSKIYEFDYDYGVITSYRAYDSLGQVAYSHRLPFGTGKFVYSYSNGQNSLVKEMKAGESVGKSLAYYKSGQLRESKIYENGLVEGPYEYYYRDGQIRTKGQFFNDELSGHWVRYYENGNKRNEGDYSKDEEEGLWKYYYENGALESSSEYKKGKKIGRSLYYDIDGKSIAVEKIYSTDREIQYRYLKPDGTWCEMKTLTNDTGTIEAYYQNGNKSLAHQYYKGKLHGKQLEWYANGQLKEEFYLEKGDYHGDYTRYYPSGKKRYITPHWHDMIHGTYREYYESGQLKAEISYVMDEKHGWEIQYNEDGSIKEKIYYWNGLEY